jgi:hypothetical protein
VLVIGAVGLELAGIDLRHRLALRDAVALFHLQRDEPPADLRRDGHVVGGDDAVSTSDDGWQREVVVGAVSGAGNQREDDKSFGHLLS